MPDGPNYNFQQAASYVPGMLATNRNPEMGQLMGMFAGQILGPMFGPENFIPHLTPSMGVMDQYAMRHFQNQQFMSATALSTANNENVAARLLAFRTAATRAPASEQNRNQALNIAGVLNHPIFKGIAGALIGSETLEAMLHGTKGDVSQLHNATMRMGYYRNDPSGSRRMDAQSMEDFSRGVYAHLYEEGGNFDVLTQQAEFGVPEEKAASRARLRKAARVDDNTEIVTATEFVDRVKKDDPDMQAKIDQIYKTYVQGDETDVTKQAAAIAKINPAVAATGLLSANEMMLPQLRQKAEKMQIAEMHGLMAGQVGQLAEYMNHRGMLPQAIGAMSAADRVKLMGGQLDDDTLNRLAMQEAKRDLFASSEAYRNANPAEQERMEQDKAAEHRKTIQSTSAAITNFNQTGAGSIADLEKMGGFEALAGNVDSQRTASALKKYSGAVDAIREIFGDNGNPNAPMPALLAALDHLTQGANFQMDAKDVETTLRQMQLTAKEAGIGFEQMSGMAAQMGAAGQMMGLSPTAIMHGQVNAMAMIKTMRDTGAFATPRFGAMGQGEAQQMAAQKIIAGDASDNAKAMAAAASIYQTGKESFAGSEFAAAMEAYLGGKNTYDFGNEKGKNLFEMVGREGPSAIMRMFTSAGGQQEELMTAFRSPLAQELLRSGAGMLTQKYEAVRDIGNFGMTGFLSANIEEFTDANKGSMLAAQNVSDVGQSASTAVTNMLVETAGLKTNEQVDFVKRELPNQLKNAFKTQFNLDDAQAKTMADEAFAAMVGTVDPNATDEEQNKQRAEQNRRILQMRNQADAVISNLSRGQMNLVNFGQHYAAGRPEKALEAAAENQRTAARRAEAGLSFKSDPIGRASDLFMDAGMSGEKLSFERILGEVLNIVPNKELANRYAGELRGGLDAANTRLQEITYTDTYLNKLASRGTDAADKELRDLAARAGITDEIKFYDTAAYNAGGAAAAEKILKSDDDNIVRQAYLAASGEQSTGLSVSAMRAELSGSGRIAANFRDQQAENAFYRMRAAESASINDDNVTLTHASVFGGYAGKDKTKDVLRAELLASDFGVREGRRLADLGGVTTRRRLADKLKKEMEVIGTLRDDAAEKGGTKEEVAFLNMFNAAVLEAGDAGPRKKLVSAFTSAYGLSDLTPDDKVSKEDELDQLLRNTNPDDKEAQKKLADFVRASMVKGKDAKDIDEAAITRGQAAAETVRRAAGIAPSASGITDPKQIGDITTKDATINATTVVINSDTVKDNKPLPPTEAEARAKAAAAQTEQTYGTTPPSPADSGTTDVPAEPGTQSVSFSDTLQKLQTDLQAGNPAAFEAIGLSDITPDLMRAAGYSQEAIDANTSNPTQKALQVNNIAQQAVQQNKNTGGDGVSGTVTGELSIVNLEKAVFTILNKRGSIMNTPGDLPVMG